MFATIWYEADHEKAHEHVFSYVKEVEINQSSFYERLIQYAYLYDPNERTTGVVYPMREDVDRTVENAIASAVDAVHAEIAAQKVATRLVTKGGDWSTQRKAKRLSWYMSGLRKALGLDAIRSQQFKDAEVKGTGFVLVYPDFHEKTVRVERILADDLVVDEAECRTTKRPPQLHRRMFVDRAKLRAEYPESAADIDKANATWGYWAEWRPIRKHEVVALESWRPACGKPGDSCKACGTYEYEEDEKRAPVSFRYCKEHRFQPGRHTICIDGATLLDEVWIEEYYPISRMAWTERDKGYFGIGLVERTAKLQYQLNKAHWAEERLVDNWCQPVTWVHQSDAKITVASKNRLGTFGVYKTVMPQTVYPTGVTGDWTSRRYSSKEAIFEESGVSRMAATSKIPAGIRGGSGAALREYKDQTTGRFRLQEEANENAALDLDFLVLAACKKLGKDAPIVLHHAHKGFHKLELTDLLDGIELSDVRIWMEAASSLPDTPAGRQASVSEWAAAGVISQDEARRLLDPSGAMDLEAAISMYTAALEDIERCIEEVLDGEILVPEPLQNLKMGVWRFQQSYHLARQGGAPEEILEGLRVWIEQALHLDPSLRPFVYPHEAQVANSAPPMDPTMAAAPAEAQGMLPPGVPEQMPPMPAVAA